MSSTSTTMTREDHPTERGGRGSIVRRGSRKPYPWSLRALDSWQAALELRLDRLLHPLRRRSVASRLRRQGLPSSVLLICTGNICRSPYAAAALARRLRMPGCPVRIESAGFLAGERVPPAEARSAAARRGIDLDAHRSRTPPPALVREASLVVVMEPVQRDLLRRCFGRPDAIVLGDLDPEPVAGRSIPDPMNEDAAAFERSYDRIDRCLDELVRSLLSGG